MEARKRFFSLLFKDLKGQIEIREIGSKNTQKFFRSLKELSEYKPPLDRNVYFGVYHRSWKHSGTAENCTITNAVFLDFDKIDLPEIKKRLHKANLPDPSIIVSSGGGFHCYWLLAKPAKDVTKLLRYLANITGADIKATDRARILRFPDTNNCKYDPPCKCEIVQIHNNRFDISDFGFMQDHRLKNFKSIPNLKIKRKCIEKMLEGVKDGFRHFSLGRITKYLQQQGYKKNDVLQTVLDWNQSNKPPLKEKDILSSFYKFWNTYYNLFGCIIPDLQQQAKLSRFCNKPECQYRYFGAKLIYNKSIGLNNLIFNDYSRISGYELILYSILKRHSEGLNSSQIEDKITCNATGKHCMSRKIRSRSLNNLRKYGFIEVVTYNRRTGKSDFYQYKPQGTFGLGFTILTNGSINGAIDKRITATELKIYVLLNKFCNDGKSFPSLRTLSKETGISRQSISFHIKELEKADYLKKHYSYNEKGSETRIYELLI